MTTLLGRLATRLGATAVVAAAGLAVTAAPAAAAPGVDLAVTISAGSVASGSEGKPFMVKVQNLGDAKVEQFELEFDLAGIDASRVNAKVPEEIDQNCTQSGKKFECVVTATLVRQDSLEFAVMVSPVDRAKKGDAGSFTATANAEGDTNAGNNSATAKVTVTAPGVDIVVWGEDVVAGYDEGTGEVQRIAPGGTGELKYGIANGGSLTAVGLELVLQLPEHVTFVANPGGCVMSADNRKATCTSDPNFPLAPDQGVEGTVAVKVAANAPQSVELKGVVTGRAFAFAKPQERRAAGGPKPGWCKGDAKGYNPTEIDKRDNQDEFVVFVGSTGGSGGGLPVTGPKAIAIGGAGAAALAVGVFLFVAARRRRVVLVTPAE
jgi:hypothetical protein